jgi:UDPglucose 6-dehydrogenase
LLNKVSFIGLGYVGLTTAICFASKGIEVTGYDTDLEKIKKLKEGKLTIFEPGLEDLFKSTKVNFTEDPKHAIRNSDIVFITVGTPSNEDGSINLSYVKSAAKTIGENLNEYKVIVVKSTVIPGTTMGPVREEIERASGMKCCKDFGLVMNPEFLKEGTAVKDTFYPDRLVIGESDKKAGDIILNLYSSFYNVLPPLVRTTPENAELIKYANNSFLAIKVSFANMMARLCMKIPGADVDTVMKGIGLDKRIGPDFLNAGIAWGGSCFPKDLKALVSFAKEKGVSLDLVEAALKLNNRGPKEVVEILDKEIGSLNGKRIGVLGVSFKPGTDDVRESPALYLISELISKGAEVIACDPKAVTNLIKVNRQVDECMKGADAVILATEWEEYKKLEARIFKKHGVKLVIDTRRVYNLHEFEEEGVKLIQLGKGIMSNDNKSL